MELEETERILKESLNVDEVMLIENAHFGDCRAMRSQP